MSRLAKLFAEVGAHAEARALCARSGRRNKMTGLPGNEGSAQGSAGVVALSAPNAASERASPVSPAKEQKRAPGPERRSNLDAARHAEA